MMNASIGDLARHYALQNASQRLKSTMDVLTQEMTSGQVADLGQRLGGNMMPIHHIQNRLRLLDGYAETTALAGQQADVMQTTLSSLQSINATASADLALATQSPIPGIATVRAREALRSLDVAVNQLNTSAAGKYVFSGTATDRPPLVSATEIMDHLAALTAGLTQATDVETAVRTWFDAPVGGGGFLDLAYRGEIGSRHEVRLSETDAATFETDATAAPIRDLLKGLAMAGLLERGTLAGLDAERTKMLELSGSVLLGNQDDLVAMASELGVTQERVSKAQTANEAERASFEIARNTLTSADPFATATALSEVQNQVQMLYSITSRLHDLKLVNFLR